MSQPPVTLSISKGVALIGLCRPDRGNAIDLPMAQALNDAAAEVGALSTVGAVVVFGHGQQFCVGGDLHKFSAADTPGAFVRELADTAHDAVLKLRALPVPVISAVHGACAGGGIGLALATDLVLAEQTAQFVVAHTAAGLSPDCGVSWPLPRVIGQARANDLILTNRPVDGIEAQRLGLISQVVEPATVYERATQLAGSIAGGPRDALSRSVQLVRHASSTALEEHLQSEANSIASLVETHDATEGISAILQKRSPTFTTDRGVQQP